VIFWSLGLPTIHFAGADNVTSVSDTLTNSDPSALSNHTITFTTPTGVTTGNSIVITFPASFNISTSSVDETDIDIATSTDYTVGAACGGATEVSAAIAGQDLTLTFCAAAGAFLSANGTTTIQIGTNAAGGDQRITNPNTVGSYEINVVAGADSGYTRVAIIQNVDVSASVDTVFTFSVAGVGPGQTVNGTSTTGTSTSTTIPFGKLTGGGQATTTAQDLTVTTNAKYGYVVTVEQSQNLISSTGADIDGFADGAYTSTPTTWTFPSGDVDDENTFGHWGITTDDATTTRTVEFGSGEYISASTTPEVIMSHDGPADGATQGVGTARIGYTIAITSLQEAGDDYATTLTYIATPTF
jgi:uncharacterized protein YaaQ